MGVSVNAGLAVGVFIGWVTVCLVVVAFMVALDRVLARRTRLHDDAVAAAEREGYDVGEAARLAGHFLTASDLAPLSFNPATPRRTRRHVTEQNCARAYARGCIRGFVAADRARMDAELDSTADERYADDIARLQAYANGEHAR